MVDVVEWCLVVVPTAREWYYVLICICKNFWDGLENIIKETANSTGAKMFPLGTETLIAFVGPILQQGYVLKCHFIQPYVIIGWLLLLPTSDLMFSGLQQLCNDNQIGGSLTL